MKTPDYLKKGDTIGITATARKISMEEIQRAVYILESWGLRVKLGKYIFNQSGQFAGTDEERASDFQQMIDNDSIKAVLCARGGYGTLRILDKINFSKFAEHSKWISGYSDITVLHSHIHSLFGIETIHGAMPLDFTDEKSDAVRSLKKILFGEKINYAAPPHPLNRQGSSSGILTGGNLSILYSLRGTVSDTDTDHKILVIEDIDEYLYHVDRMMMNLKRGGKLSRLKGLIVGGMTDMHDNTVPFGKTAYEIIFDAVKEYDYPVCFNFPAGHLKGENHAMILGRKILLNVSNQKTYIQF